MMLVVLELKLRELTQFRDYQENKLSQMVVAHLILLTQYYLVYYQRMCSQCFFKCVFLFSKYKVKLALKSVKSGYVPYTKCIHNCQRTVSDTKPQINCWTTIRTKYSNCF